MKLTIDEETGTRSASMNEKQVALDWDMALCCLKSAPFTRVGEIHIQPRQFLQLLISDLFYAALQQP